MIDKCILESQLFDQVPCENMDALLHCLQGRKRHFKAGAMIMEYDGKAKSVGIIERGIVRLIRLDYMGDYSLLERMEKSDIFGETIAYSSFAKENEQIFAQSETDCDIIFVDSEKILKPCKNVCSCHMTVLWNLLTIISNKTRILSRRLEILSHRTIRAKLMCYFSMEAQKNKSNVFSLPFSTSALAEYLCIDRCAMTRELSKMKKEGILEMNRRNIVLNNKGEEL